MQNPKSKFFELSSSLGASVSETVQISDVVNSFVTHLEETASESLGAGASRLLLSKHALPSNLVI